MIQINISSIINDTNKYNLAPLKEWLLDYYKKHEFIAEAIS